MTQSTPPARRRPPPLLFWTLAVAFIAIPLIEVWGLVWIGGWLGLWPTVLLLLVGAVIGAWLTRREGSRAWKALVNAVNGGNLPTGRLADAALVLVGGVLLMLPGFFTDVVGLGFLLPFTRPLVRRLLAFVLAKRVARSSTDSMVIPGELDPES